MSLLHIQPYTFGMGDRFAHQGQAQLRAVIEARNSGIDLFPVWNKSHREHSIVGSQPDDLRAEADNAVRALGWKEAYYVDADHIRLDTFTAFLPGSDFFTLDVADYVGETPDPDAVDAWIAQLGGDFGDTRIDGLDAPLILSEAHARDAADRYFAAIQKAGELYRKIAGEKAGSFVVEISIDETDQPQGPEDIFFILSMIAAEKIPAQTIAPKFNGRFNKGVDYVGDLGAFEREFRADLCVIRYAVKRFGLPESLKISVHSGSDKFSLYPIINRLIREHGAGLHVKTAGTTWLEEVIGLARSGGEGLAIAKEIYTRSLRDFEELTEPYRTVIDIDPGQLPEAATVADWSPEQFANALEHKPEHPSYNPHLRQLIHVGFKVAAKMADRYTDALRANAGLVERGVTHNLLERHIRPIFGNSQ